MKIDLFGLNMLSTGDIEWWLLDVSAMKSRAFNVKLSPTILLNHQSIERNALIFSTEV
jgi:hypothetical protein